MIKVDDNYIINSIQRYKNELSLNSDRAHSFDYCFNYFKRNCNTSRYSFADNMELSSLHLGFYLASWGMYRGSSYLLQNSLSIYEKVIEYFDVLKKNHLELNHLSPWDIDVSSYNEDSIKFLLNLHKNIKECLKINTKEPSDILITKIMLGVFGNVPAYDAYFKKTFKLISKDLNYDCAFTSFNSKSLKVIKKFYDKHKQSIDTIAQTYTTVDFSSKKKTDINYTKAKTIDMFGFMCSFQNK
ncbi:hypothetical protein [Bartonella sp. HY038]|uniref:hypothetical protein n=1 Tax=Bartonella sp. HY038 TaxID=2759660 RepID=UPI0015FC847B|nr:hypothetical protein [Bartonella sp. HY038]